jgi:hypothetical protein
VGISIAHVAASFGEPQRSYLSNFKIATLPSVIGLFYPIVKALLTQIVGLPNQGLGKYYGVSKGIQFIGELTKKILALIFPGKPIANEYTAYLTTICTIIVTDLCLGDIDIYCKKTFFPGRSTQMMPMTMFGQTVYYAGTDTSKKQGVLDFVVDEFGFCRLFFESLKNLTGASRDNGQVGKFIDNMIEKIKAQGSIKNLILSGFGTNLVSGSTSDFVVYSVGMDKSTITDGTLLRAVQVHEIQELTFDKADNQTSPMTLRVGITWDSQDDSIASISWAINELGKKIGGPGIIGSFRDLQADWNTGKVYKEASWFRPRIEVEGSFSDQPPERPNIYEGEEPSILTPGGREIPGREPITYED